MGADSKIEWCDHTFNPWIGCTKVSPGCAHCYAEGESKLRGWAQWGKGKKRHRTSADYWNAPIAWNRRLEQRPLKRRQRVFCASLLKRPRQSGTHFSKRLDGTVFVAQRAESRLWARGRPQIKKAA
jgi:protein gp37